MTDDRERAAVGTEPNAERRGGAAVDRALAIVAAVANNSEPLRRAALSSATGLYKSTILRLLGSLEGAGYVDRLHDGRYSLGPAADWLGKAYDHNNMLRHHILPALQDLVAGGSESASFHVRNGPNTRLCLLRVDSSHPTLDRVYAGSILPFDRGAAERVLLAFSDEPRSAYERLRANRLAHSIGERETGCAGMASPVFAIDGTLVGALSLSGPAARFTSKMRAEWGPRLVATASEVSTMFGACFQEDA